MKISSLFLIVSTALYFQACSSGDEKKETLKISATEIPVRVQRIVKQEIMPVIETSGLFTTDDETMLSFKIGGVINRIYVKEGDAIKKGQLLATLNLTEIEAQVMQAKLALEKSIRDFNRVENLYRDSVVTLEQYQNAKTSMQVAQQQVQTANFNRAFSEIRALSNGYVLRKIANEGQVITAGNSVLQTNGASQTNWKLRVGVSDREWALCSVGDKASVTTDAVDNIQLDAYISRKSESTDGVSGTFALELSVKKSEAALASGLFGKASITTSHKQTLWSIPYDALLDGNAQSGYVFTTNDLKTVQKTTVMISSINRDQVLISSGLEEKQHVIISGSAYLKESSLIKVLK